MNALHMTSACKPSLARVAARPAQRAQRVAAQAAATEPKLLAKSPIPAFIPRDDLMQQIHRWANVEVVGNGASNFGMACTMEELFREADDGQTWPWGLLINLERVRRPQIRIVYHLANCDASVAYQRATRALHWGGTQSMSAAQAVSIRYKAHLGVLLRKIACTWAQDPYYDGAPMVLCTNHWAL